MSSSRRASAGVSGVIGRATAAASLGATSLGAMSAGAVALAFAREGADVLISYLNEDSDAEETARVVREAGRTAVLAPGDISNQAHCRALVERAISELGRLDILVNNAADRQQAPLTEISLAQWRHITGIIVDGAFLCARACLPPMIAAGGGTACSAGSTSVGGRKVSAAAVMGSCPRRWRAAARRPAGPPRW